MSPTARFAAVAFAAALVPVAPLAILAAGCAPAPPVAETSDAVTLAAPIDFDSGAQIVGASADRRFVAYAAPCDPDARDTPTLRLYDDWTGAIRRLGAVADCRPDGVQFSGDGALAAWPRSPGVAVVTHSRGGPVVQVSRDELRAVGVAFSPDSRWLVVASMANPPAVTLDAWDADLRHHVEVGHDIYVNPFGPPRDLVKFSPDGAAILFVGGVTSPFPVGTLTLWTRAGARAEVLADGVAAFAVSDDFCRVAYLGGVVVGSGPPSAWLHGRLAVERLADRHVDVVAADVAATPQRFLADGTLVYLVGAVGAGPQTLAVVAPGGAPRIIDSGLFQSFSPLASVAVGPGERTLAYLTAFDPMSFSGQLRVATLDDAGAPVVVAADAVPAAFGWVDDALVYLHAPGATFPGAAVGALAAWRADRGSAALADDVTQVGLRFSGGRALYFSDWDANRAAGVLHVWDAALGRDHRVAADVFAMALQPSPDGSAAGLVTLGPDPADGTPPPTTLKWAPLDGGRARTVAPGTTSFTVGNFGRVLYTTPAGLWGALVF